MKKFLLFSFVFYFLLIVSGLAQVDTLWTKSTGRYIGFRVKFTSDGQNIVTALSYAALDTTGYVQLLSTSSGTVVWEQPTYRITDMIVSDDSNFIATSHYNGKVNLWDLSNGDLIHTFNKEFFDSTNSISIDNLCSSRDSRYLFAIVGFPDLSSAKIFKIDLQTDSIVKSKEVLANFIKYSPTSDVIAVAGDINENDHFIKLLDANTLETDKIIYPHNKLIVDITFSPNGQYLASSSMDGTAKIFDMPNLNLSHSFSYNDSGMWPGTIEISSDNKYLVTGGDGYSVATTKVWDINTDINLHTYDLGAICLSISPDINYLAIGVQHKIYLFDFITDTTSAVINVHPQEIKLIYPNPTDGKINLELNVENSGQYSIKIINEKGNEIQQIRNDTFDVGKHEINCDAGKLPAGVYFIIVRGKNYSETYKFIKE